MVKTLLIGAFVLAVSFFVTSAAVHAQTTTATPTATPTTTTSPTTTASPTPTSTVPSGAPATGFGN